MMRLVNEAFSKATQEKIALIFNEIRRHFNCTYLNYNIENVGTNRRLIYQSNTEWHKRYAFDGLYEDCPLTILGRTFLNTRGTSIIIPWDGVKAANKKQIYVNDARQEHSLYSGVTFCQQFLGFAEHVSFATDHYSTDFAHEMTKNFSTLREYIRGIRCLALADLIAAEEVNPEINQVLFTHYQASPHLSIEVFNVNELTKIKQIEDLIKIIH